MKKRLFLAVICLLLMTGFAAAKEQKPKDDYFYFNSPKLIEINNKDIDKAIEDFKLQTKDGEEFDAVINKIESNKIAISPIEKTEKPVKIKDLKGYTVRDFDKLIHVQNEKNLENILKSIYKHSPPIMLKSAQVETAVQENMADSAAPGKTAQNEDFTKTNVQTEGIDEADIVKTDGKYIYYKKDNYLVVVEAGKDPKVVLKMNTKDDKKMLQSMFLDKDRLILIYNRYKDEDQNTEVLAEIYDTKNIKNPKLLRTETINGYYQEARKKGKDIYLISSDYFRYKYRNFGINPLSYNPNPDKKQQLQPYDMDLNKLVYLPFTPSFSVTKIRSMNIDKNETPDDILIMGQTGDIYMSEKNMYISSTSYDYDKGYFNENTNIKKFSLKDGKFVYSSNKTLEGSLVNQFALNEINDTLYAALTKNRYTDDSQNYIASLDKDMKLISKTENLAKGERIYSVRYMGDKAFMVTFKQVDPLFTIDIKDPKNMKVLGYLKIPGYSQYLHPYRDKYLIGFGQNTRQINNNSVINDGFKISLFDVSDYKNPKEIDVKNIGDRGTYSDILYDHKSLMFDYRKNIFSIPIQVDKAYKKEKEDFYNTKEVFNGAYVFEIKDNKKIDIIGDITHFNKDEINQMKYYNRNYDKVIQRIIEIGDNIYTISNYGIKVNDIKTMKEISFVKF